MGTAPVYGDGYSASASNATRRSAMRLGRSSLLALAVGLVATGCSPLAATRPDAQTFQAVGILSGLSELTRGSPTPSKTAGRGTDRRTSSASFTTCRPGRPCSSRARTRPARTSCSIGGQDGPPPDCPHSLRYGAREWGDAIESQGYLWHKADNFAVLTPSPGVGAEYPGSAIVCLDAEANVTAVLRLTPPEGSEPRRPARRPLPERTGGIGVSVGPVSRCGRVG